MTQPIYAIGDIHGQKALLDHALALIESDAGREARVVFLGDYIDRGPDSRGVIDTLIEGQASGRDWICLRGNHDTYLPRFFDAGEAYTSKGHPDLPWWAERLGGDATLASYGIEIEGKTDTAILKETRAKVPPAHRDFLAACPLYHREPGLIFVHAGLRPGLPPEKQSEEDLMWIREPFLSDPRDHGAIVVHGHTAIDAPCHHGNRVNLDGGTGWGRPLHPAVIEDGKFWMLTAAGRQPLDPVG
ncbi:metallophosphoesterase family protein [uncultured Roseovarius sp.]|uniref:metallophosphoesterase family protein n=1 Tax=uncultured Roseovarius sp. TaxID=293344 RepID=UPI0025FF34EA|nr:metallophosphoesterase family protein [uncultured Roseovarius sp.]